MNKKYNVNVGSSTSSQGRRGKHKLKIVDQYEDPNSQDWYGSKRTFENCPTYSSLQ